MKTICAIVLGLTLESKAALITERVDFERQDVSALIRDVQQGLDHWEEFQDPRGEVRSEVSRWNFLSAQNITRIYEHVDDPDAFQGLSLTLLDETPQDPNFYQYTLLFFAPFETVVATHYSWRVSNELQAPMRRTIPEPSLAIPAALATTLLRRVRASQPPAK